MKVLLLGDDGRAHALAWKLFNSPLVDELICAPGNGGTAPLVPAAALELADAVEIARWAFAEGIDIIVPVGSRALHAGLVDEVVALHIGVCGPSQRSAALERSRCQAKEFMLRANLPTPPGRAFTDLATAEKYLATQPLPLMIKADHPAAGEASFDDRYAALEGLRDLFNARTLEGSNNGVVIERYMTGARVVFSAFTDGRAAVPLLPVRLYDRVEQGDIGASARGVGAHTSSSIFARRLAEHLHQKFILPIVAGLARDGLPYWGILGIDCIITASGPWLVGLRSSMREGEAQVVLPRLEDDLLPWIQAMIAQRLHELPAPVWSPVASVGIGLMARGYPHHFPTGGAIRGVEDLDAGVLAFHSATENPAGLRYTPRVSAASSLGRSSARGPSLPIFSAGAAGIGATYTTGGLVMTIVAQSATLAGARGRALINAERVMFEGRTFRSDIAAKEFG
jgi:phosphoribosylamine---glycine ligase